VQLCCVLTQVACQREWGASYHCNDAVRHTTARSRRAGPVMPSIGTDSLEGTSGSDRGSDDRDIVFVSSAVGDTSSSPPLVRTIEANGAQSLVVPPPVLKISLGCPGSDVQGVMYKDDLQASTKDAVVRECARSPNGIGINGCAGDCQGPRGEENKAAGDGAGDSQQGITETPTVVNAGSAGEAATGGEGEGEDLLQDMRALTSKVCTDSLDDLRPIRQNCHAWWSLVDTY
jgi:hypothetical protein